MLHAQELLHRLAGLKFGRPIYLFQTVGSTNDQARQMAEAGAPEGLLIVAEEQTAGRGRGGRRWLTPPGAGLAVSVLLRPAAATAAQLSMLAGLSVCEAVEQVTGVAAQLKWPNDVLINGRKAAGVLGEAVFHGEQLAHAVLGLGLNVSWAPPPEQVDFPATCLEAEAGRPIDRPTLLRAVLVRLEAHYPELGEAALFAAWRARLTWLGTPIALQLGAETLTGQAVDVDAQGALIFRSESGETRTVLAGDVHLRPLTAGPD